MKKLGRPLIWSCILLAIINFIWLGFNSFMYLDIPELVKRPDTIIILIFLGIIMLFFNHLLIFLTVSLTLQRSKRMFSAGIMLLVLGSVSFMAIIVHLSGLMDIGKEVQKGYSISEEVRAVWLSQFIHLVFLLYSIIYFITIIRSSYSIDTGNSVFREQLFSTLNIMGIVCSIVGMLVIWFYFERFNTGINVHHRLRRYDIIPLGFVFMPYLLVLTGWGIIYVKDRLKGWYDEKQVSDINRSGMTALLLSLPLVIYAIIHCYLATPAVAKDIYIQGTIAVLWLPLYLFVLLLVFSASALYHYRNN